MAKLKGQFVKTDLRIYDLSGPSGNEYMVVDDGKHKILSTKDKRLFLYEVEYETELFQNLINFGKDILEIREPGNPVRYALAKAMEGELILTNEGLVGVEHIKAILEHSEWTDSYVRMEIL